MESPVLRHRRLDEEELVRSTVYSEDDVFEHRKKSRRRLFTWPRVLFAAAALGSLIIVYQYRTLNIPYYSSKDSWQLPLTGLKPLSGPDVERRNAIVDAFKHSWSAYERDAMGADEYHPLSRRGSNFSTHGGIGYTVIDALDTMYLMGLKEEYRRARHWLATAQSFDRDENYNTFETTIRVLGGLLSMYNLTKDRLFLSKAEDLAQRILPVFDTPTGLPLSMANLGLRKAVDDRYRAGFISTAEATTLQLEWRYLSHATGNPVYWDKVEKVMNVLETSKRHSDLVPIYMNANSGLFVDSEIRLGSRGDSYYEYLLKQYLQTNRTEPIYRGMYDGAMKGIHEKLVHKGAVKGLTFTGELIPSRSPNAEENYIVSLKQDHLVCFLAGSLMLGAATIGVQSPSVSRPPKADQLTSAGQRDWRTGYELLETCIDTHNTATGLSPEIVYFHTVEEAKKSKGGLKADWYIKGSRPGAPGYDARYILRPETVESVFIAYRLTGDARYRDIGWKIFRAIDKYCRVESGGYASVLDVDDVHTRKDDKMETFWLSETLKYLFLLFSDESVIPLNEYVFNTEAHPLPIFTPTRTLADF